MLIRTHGAVLAALLDGRIEKVETKEQGLVRGGLSAPFKPFEGGGVEVGVSAVQPLAKAQRPLHHHLDRALQNGDGEVC